MKQKYIWLALLAVAGIGFLWWNNKRIDTLKKQMEYYKLNPPAVQDKKSWLSVLGTMLDLGLNIYDQFGSKGDFEGKLDQSSIDELLRILRSTTFIP